MASSMKGGEAWIWPLSERKRIFGLGRLLGVNLDLLMEQGDRHGLGSFWRGKESVGLTHSRDWEGNLWRRGIGIGFTGNWRGGIGLAPS